MKESLADLSTLSTITPSAHRGSADPPAFRQISIIRKRTRSSQGDKLGVLVPNVLRWHEVLIGMALSELVFCRPKCQGIPNTGA